MLKNLPAFTTKTTAENRVNAYVPDDKLNIRSLMENMLPLNQIRYKWIWSDFVKKPG